MGNGTTLDGALCLACMSWAEGPTSALYDSITVTLALINGLIAVIEYLES